MIIMLSLTRNVQTFLWPLDFPMLDPSPCAPGDVRTPSGGIVADASSWTFVMSRFQNAIEIYCNGKSCNFFQVCFWRPTCLVRHLSDVEQS